MKAAINPMTRTALRGPAAAFVALIAQLRLAQVEFAFDPAPRLVGQHAGAEPLVDLLPLGGDQLELDLVVQIA